MQEALQLPWGAGGVDMERGTIFSRTKTGNPRTVDIHPRVESVLLPLWLKRGKPASGHVFLNRIGALHGYRQRDASLVERLEDTLRALGERGDIIRTMQRDLTARNLVRPGVDQALFDPASGDAAPVVGRVVTRGLADEHRDRHYLLVDGIDGRTHYVDIGRGDATDPTPEGSIVRVVPRSMSIARSTRSSVLMMGVTRSTCI